MSKIKSLIIASVAILIAFAPLAKATTLWNPDNGSINFPGLNPSSINNMPIGATTQASGAFSTLKLDDGTKTAVATSGAATLNKQSGIVTSEALTTAAGASYVLTITNSGVLATDIVMASVQYGTSTTGSPAIVTVKVNAGSLVITVQNIHASAALNGTIKIAFSVLKS